MKIHYAMQVCDIANNQVSQRYCNSDRTTLSIKSTSSFINSVAKAQRTFPGIVHHVVFIDDHSTHKIKAHLKHLKNKYENKNLIIDIIATKQQGLMSSIRECYNWLITNGTNLVYQVQDDYLFSESAITEMIDVFFQIKMECGTDIIVSPYNDPWLWLAPYRNRMTPRVVIVGKGRYWISYYDMSCSFMTSTDVIRQNWDLIDEFCNMPPRGINGDLENLTLNKMLVERGILGLVPINNLALHVQSELEKDPYIDWESWWNSIQ